MGVMDKGRYLAAMIKKHGIRGFVIKTVEKRKDPEECFYRMAWHMKLVSEEQWKIQRNTTFDEMPMISVAVAAYETPEPFMEALIASLQRQSYQNWQLCIADGSITDRVAHVAEHYQGQDSRICYLRLKKNGGISENMNAAAAMAEGSFVGFLDHDDMLAADALYEVVRMINSHMDCDVIYTDEDKVNAEGNRHFCAHRKLDFNQELLRHYNYICHFLVVRRRIFEQVGGFRKEYDGSQDYDLLLRLAEQKKRFYHINKILYHWRVHPGSTAGNALHKDYAYDAGKRALEDYVKRNQIAAQVQEIRGEQSYGLRYELKGQKLTVVDYQHSMENMKELMEDISTEYVLLYDGSKMKEPSEKQQQELLRYTTTGEYGMVGARLALGRRLVSAGLLVDEIGWTVYQFGWMPAYFKGPFNRAVIPQNVLALPLDCFLIRCDLWRQMEDLWTEGYNLDIALKVGDRVRQAGYEVVLDAELTIKYKGRSYERCVYYRM